MEEEIWKEIKGYEGHYSVSNKGRIKSFKRNREKILIQTISCGYCIVSLFLDGESRTSHVHVLVAVAFLNHSPNRHSIVVDHKDNDKLNNNISNLQLITSRENSTKDKKRGVSRFVGVTYRKKLKKFHASISLDKKRIHLGYFSSEIEAGATYIECLEILNNQGQKAMLDYVAKGRIKYKNRYRGVYPVSNSNTWYFQVMINGEKHKKYSFNSEEEAYKARIAFTKINGEKQYDRLISK